MTKKRIVKDYEKLPEDIVARIKMEYSEGFVDNLIKYTNKEGKYVSALPFETEDIYYLVRMTAQEAEQIIEDDEDYDDEGNLREDFSLGAKDEEILSESEDEDEDTDPYKDDEDEEDDDDR